VHLEDPAAACFPPGAALQVSAACDLDSAAALAQTHKRRLNKPIFIGSDQREESMRDWRELRGYFRALADVRRLRIVAELAHTPEITVKELCSRLRASQPLVSWHLRVLVRCGLVRTRRQGRQVFCALNRPAFHAYGDRLSRMLEDAAVDESAVARDDPSIMLPQHPPLGA
jgi:ArsR family transcriptional regulator